MTFLACRAFAFLWFAQGFAQTVASLQVDLSKPVHPVSPMLYGLMTEEINYSYDGGLYAEMVRNRTFQDHGWDGIAHWTLVEKGDSAASIAIDSNEGPSAALQHSLRLDVKRADAASPAGVRNAGYWGMAVRPNTTYRGSLYAKTDAPGVGGLAVSLVNDDSGKAVATATLDSLSTTWKRYEFTLKTGGNVETSAENHLALTVEHPGKVWLDLVSLFPPTYNNRQNGNRIDLMEKLAAMHPTFLRLPGGNYLEGDEIQDRFDWKRDDRSAGGPADTSQPVELPVVGRTGIAGVSGVVRGSEHSTGAGGVCRLLAEGRARDTRSGVGAVCRRCAGRDRVRDRRCIHEVGRGPREVRAPGAVSADLCRNRQ